ncbi:MULTISPECIES: HesB/IscA family protein [Hyphomicrobium]|jgi:iron-sulfur cluster assembly protein|uniref:HesB/IscA family protein n=1 Tax=Hyphomicrobium TaxID=81 RepID=UPI001FD9F495|nr:MULTISPECIES: iron-sulfur cluster assembly accessory protein [Hyphomicrobium]WBT37410.1 iron-sulfur cluster assembly accessory protein [Hyphomicrobium sp. DMF-1]HML42828.1 iron-sulfur cluster assembly accessory protein [Hyphomicrobium zavarzinii]
MTDQTTSAPRRPRPKVMTLTPRAAERVRAIMASKGPDVAGLKIGIKKGGCAGMEYTMSWTDTVGKFDETVEQDGARVIIDPQAVLYLLGTEMDYKTDKLSATFVFNNPNQKGACGCGESVNLVPAGKSELEALND